MPSVKIDGKNISVGGLIFRKTVAVRDVTRIESVVRNRITYDENCFIVKAGSREIVVSEMDAGFEKFLNAASQIWGCDFSSEFNRASRESPPYRSVTWER